MFCSLGYLIRSRVTLGVGIVINNHVPGAPPGEPEESSQF